VALRVNTEGQREVLGLKIGPSEAEPFWSDFLRSLNRHGLRGVKLVISDSQEGIKAAASKVLKATWRRCRVHFMRNALVHIGKTQRRMVSAAIATVFVRETADIARTQWRSVADQLRSKFPKLGTLMDEAENDVLAFMTFPRAHPASERAANIISLIESAKLNAHDPWAYLKDVFERLPTLKNTDLASILPHNWQPPARATVPGVAHQSVAAATTL
jgi:transposase-like protein